MWHWIPARGDQTPGWCIPIQQLPTEGSRPNRVDTVNQARPSTNENAEDNRENRTLCVPYMRGLSQKIDNVCWSIKGVNMRAVFKLSRPDKHWWESRIGCPKTGENESSMKSPAKTVRNWETGRTLKKRVNEHKQTDSHGVAAYVHIEDHRIDWEEAKVIPGQEFYWKRRVTEGIMIHQHNQQTINVDCGLNLSKLWHASLDKPTYVNHYN